MRKRIILMLCVCMCILGLAACGTDPKTVDYNGKTYDELEQNALAAWEAIQSLDLAQVEALVMNIESMSEAERIQVMKANEGLEDQYLLMKNWLSVSKQVGAFVGVESFNITKTGKTTTTDLVVAFEKRPVVLSIVFKNRDMSIESTTVDLVYTTGEKMQKAALNTVMGMGTVFVMLIVICLIISCFSVIPKLEKKMKDRKAPAVEEKPAAPVVSAPVQETDDLELVAVIAAAIAASTGQSTDDFVVRSIKRR